MARDADGPVTIRLARDDADRARYAELCSNAYRNSVEHFSEWLARTDPADMLCLFEGDQLAAGLIIRPYETFIGERRMPLGGIAAVATYADRQGRGYAAMLMRESLRRMRRRGECVSTLFPFSRKFYRQFGWIAANHHLQLVDIPQRDLPGFHERRLVRRFRPEDLRALVRLHDRVAARYNLCLARPIDRWRQIIDKLGERNAVLYLIVERGGLIGYFICENRKREAFNFESFTRELALANTAAVRAMLGFLRHLPANVKTISLQLPADIDPWEYLDEPAPVRLTPQQQVRIVDLAEAIRRRGYARGAAGRLVVRIADADAPWNRGAWTMSFKAGRPVSMRKSSARPTVWADIADFSQLFCGYKSAGELAGAGRIRVSSPRTIQLLDALFHDRPTATQDWF